MARLRRKLSAVPRRVQAARLVLLATSIAILLHREALIKLGKESNTHTETAVGGEGSPGGGDTAGVASEYMKKVRKSFVAYLRKAFPEHNVLCWEDLHTKDYVVTVVAKDGRWSKVLLPTSISLAELRLIAKGIEAELDLA